MKITLNTDQIDSIVKQKIEHLEQENKRLSQALLRANNKITNLQSGMDATKETRDRIKNLSETLFRELANANWIDAEW